MITLISYLYLNKKNKIRTQIGQAMAEYVVVLAFGVMMLTMGPGGDVLLDLLGVMNDNYQGYSYATSLSTIPDQDNLAEYMLEKNAEDITAVENKLKELYNIPTKCSYCKQNFAKK